MRKCGRWSVTSSGWKAVYRRKLKLPSTPPTDGGVHIVAAWRRAQIAVLGQFPSSATRTESSLATSTNTAQKTSKKHKGGTTSEKKRTPPKSSPPPRSP